jgi:hypothetical protein
MTSRRDRQTVFRVARFALAVCGSALFGACAALPDDAPVVEQLDTETGATVARLGRPFELYREAHVQSDATGRFAFIGPFETNQMGQREFFLWLAVPIEPVPDSVPAVEINGKALTLGVPGRAADFAGVHESPYKIPTPWSAMYYFKIDADTVAQIGEATDISIRTLEPGKNGPIKTHFAAKVEADPRFRDFATR